MSIELRTRRSNSWLDLKRGKALAAELGEKLVHRCKGQSGVMLTLTYRRDEYQTPRDLYHAASQDRHVRRFIERLSLVLGESLTGRWICKLEFQRGGWVHWHLILVGVEHIDHTMLTQIWGHGFVWIDRVTPKRLRYVCKYIAKGEELPAFLLHEPIRSVKVIRVSPGFWGEVIPAPDEPDHDRPPKGWKLRDCYQPIGAALEKSENSTVLRDPETGQYRQIPQPLWRLVLDLCNAGCCVVGTLHGWIRIEGTTAELLTLDRRSRPRIARGRGRARPWQRNAEVYLTDERNPPTHPRWLEKYMEEALGWTRNPSAGGV